MNNFIAYFSFTLLYYCIIHGYIIIILLWLLYIVIIVAYSCPHNDDIMCNSQCYSFNQFCYGRQKCSGKKCSGINITCSKLTIMLRMFM